VVKLPFSPLQVFFTCKIAEQRAAEEYQQRRGKNNALTFTLGYRL
jgi:hypothetical protein